MHTILYPLIIFFCRNPSQKSCKSGTQTTTQNVRQTSYHGSPSQIPIVALFHLQDGPVDLSFKVPVRVYTSWIMHVHVDNNGLLCYMHYMWLMSICIRTWSIYPSLHDPVWDKLCFIHGRSEYKASNILAGFAFKFCLFLFIIGIMQMTFQTL